MIDRQRILEPPDAGSVWLAYFYSCVVASTLLGIGCVFASLAYRPMALYAPTFFAPPAVFGALHAYRLLRYHLWARAFVKVNAKMPISIAIDGESGYAAVTTLDGELVSLYVPPEVLGAGPEAVTEFVVEAFTAD